MTRIKEIRARCEAATPGPWKSVTFLGRIDVVASRQRHDDFHVGTFFDKLADARFVARARVDIPYLLDLLEASQRRVAELERERDAATFSLAALGICQGCAAENDNTPDSPCAGCKRMTLDSDDDDLWQWEGDRDE